MRKIFKRSVLIQLENILVAKFCSDFGLLLENISKINCVQNFKVISALLCNIVLSWFEWIMLGLKMFLKAYQSPYKSCKRPAKERSITEVWKNGRSLGGLVQLFKLFCCNCSYVSLFLYFNPKAHRLNLRIILCCSSYIWLFLDFMQSKGLLASSTFKKMVFTPKGFWPVQILRTLQLLLFSSLMWQSWNIFLQISTFVL